MNKYFIVDRSSSEKMEFTSEEVMLEYVRKYFNDFGYLPIVYYGEQLEFEPAEVVKGWKVKEDSR